MLKFTRFIVVTMIVSLILANSSKAIAFLPDSTFESQRKTKEVVQNTLVTHYLFSYDSFRLLTNETSDGLPLYIKNQHMHKSFFMHNQFNQELVYSIQNKRKHLFENREDFLDSNSMIATQMNQQKFISANQTGVKNVKETSNGTLTKEVIELNQREEEKN